MPIKPIEGLSIKKDSWVLLRSVYMSVSGHSLFACGHFET
jgi:hypothetical protein